MIKVAGYCRVSTEKEDQANSFASQQRFFREYIQLHPGWLLQEIYADEGITGTSTRKRTEFNRMIRDARCGSIQLILTKEVSRFSRNILDTIAYTRELKSLGIGVIFLSDGFSSLDPDAELRLSIMGSLAQEESRKTSARVKWGQTRQMEQGVVFGRSLLGYDVKDGKLTVNPEGAKIVQLIFHKYGAEKKGTGVIARELREAGYKTLSGSQEWSGSHILKILKNEKYVGDLVQKKTYTPDYLTHEKKTNYDEEPKVILENHHMPIISRELWNSVQTEIQRRDRHGIVDGHSSRYLFSGKIKCAECGASFVSRNKKKKDGTSYRRWACLNAVKHGTKKTDSSGNTAGCSVGKVLRDDLLMQMLTFVLQNLPLDAEMVLRSTANLVYASIREGESSAVSLSKLRNQLESTAEKKRKAMDALLSGLLTEEEFRYMRGEYDRELCVLHERIEQQSRQLSDLSVSSIQAAAASIYFCREPSNAFLKCLLKQIRVYKNGLVEIQINGLSGIRMFHLEQ